MQFKAERIENPNIAKYRNEELDLAYKFAKRAYDEFGTLVKAIVIFGSVARDTPLKKEPSKKGDIDILVIIDDLTIDLTRDVVETYRVIVEKIIAETSTRLHITSLKLTSFWEYVRIGDPVGINILRDGFALLDTGFFDPLQALLRKGRIRPTPESVWTYFSRAPRTLHNSKWHILQATLDLYWAVIDSAHAALMKVGEIPPSPDHVADMLEERLVKPKLIEKRYTEIMKKFYDIQKKIMYRETKEISSKDFEEYYREASSFVARMEEFINK